MNILNAFRTTVFCLLSSAGIYAQVFTKAYAQGDTIIRQGDSYVARTVSFQLDKAVLLPDPNTTLDSIAVFLIRHDSLVLEIGVHGSTHNVATDCARITQARAKTIYDYLVAKGVQPQRMVPKGYGQKQLLYSDAEIKKQNTHDQGWMNQRNRRVEFRIMSRKFSAPK
ncbi:MAG TPA: OmpA family protein [Bacteroidia bacterium]|jgi:peptidoglycan-associated lipoprotein|nr:OmpA family protein [Bacteroidia bacterium]